MVNQYYEAEVVSEYVIKGNTAVLKCNIPSFVADFVKVEAWVGSEGSVFLPTDNFGSYALFQRLYWSKMRNEESGSVVPYQPSH